jgi:hypothetical protein
MSESNINLDAPPITNQLALDWSNKDIEQRLGLPGGKYTRANTFFTCVLGLVGACIFYAFCFLVLERSNVFPEFSEKFTQRGYIPYPIAFLFFWGLTTLFIKWRKLKFQEKALELAVVPEDPDFSLNPKTAEGVLARTDTLVDSARHFILLNRIEVALSNLRNIGQISDVSSILQSQSKMDEQQVGSSYNLIRGFIWAIPVLGFIGTVIGLGDAIGGFGAVIAAPDADIGEIKESLADVTSGLQTAFDTTLVGLLATIVLHFLTNFLKFNESLFLDDCNEYCQVRVLAKLKLTSEDND